MQTLTVEENRLQNMQAVS